MVELDPSSEFERVMKTLARSLPGCCQGGSDLSILVRAQQAFERKGTDILVDRQSPHERAHVEKVAPETESKRSAALGGPSRGVIRDAGFEKKNDQTEKDKKSHPVPWLA
jgi:hypothetical protein